MWVGRRNREWQEMREEGHVVATGLDAAVEALSVNDKEDRHPEKRAKVRQRVFCVCGSGISYLGCNGGNGIARQYWDAPARPAFARTMDARVSMA
jgi:hypothetical protein